MKRERNLLSGPMAVLKALAAVAGLAGALFVGLIVLNTLYAGFGFHPQENARAWASRMPTYSDTSACASCHVGQYLRITLGGHRSIDCETCHGPQTAHVAGSGPAVDQASDELCVRCHETVVGRPAAFPQQDVAQHFGGASCTRCHDAHSARAASPPPITHPLDKLPECTVCHGPSGMRPAPPSHASDASDTCLKCHEARQGS